MSSFTHYFVSLWVHSFTQFFELILLRIFCSVELNDYFANLCEETSYVEPTPMEICEDVNAPDISEIQVWNNLRHLEK
jgi:hypothetical protein